jgi:N6-adenosine-specific RNA methylase IME4
VVDRQLTPRISGLNTEGHMSNFHCITMDPPWMERGGGKIKRGADRHYPLLDYPGIVAAILQSPSWRPADDCHLWCWATSNHLPEAIDLVRVLGFRYLACLPWVKTTGGLDLTGRPNTRIGLGQYLRYDHELLVFATRGRTQKPPKAWLGSTIFAPRGQHSAKPEAARRMIEHISPPPRLEMFARTPSEGWTVWGNQVTP